MAGNIGLQILRGSKDFDPSTSDKILKDGQLFYSKKNDQLFVGDGESRLEQLKAEGKEFINHNKVQEKLKTGYGINIIDNVIAIDQGDVNYDNIITLDGLLETIIYPPKADISLLWTGDTNDRYNIGAYANLDQETGASKAAPSSPIIQQGGIYDGRTVLRLVYPEEGNDKVNSQIYFKSTNLGIGSIKGTIIVSKENAFTDATSLSIWGYINGKGYRSIAVLTDKLNEIEETNEYFPLEFTFNNSIENNYKAIMITYKATNQNNTIRVAELDLVAQNLTTDDRNKLNKLDITGDGIKFLADDGKYKDIEVSLECIINTLAPNATKTIDLTNTDAGLIDWGDGTISSTLSHTYVEDGIYTIKIYGVNDIKSTFKSNYSLIQVRILNNIKTISQSAFRGAKNLTNVYIGSCVKLISDIAFDGTSMIPTIVFESAVPPALGTIVSDTSGARHFNKSSKLIVPKKAIDLYKVAFGIFSANIDNYATGSDVIIWREASIYNNAGTFVDIPKDAKYLKFEGKLIYYDYKYNPPAPYEVTYSSSIYSIDATNNTVNIIVSTNGVISMQNLYLNQDDNNQSTVELIFGSDFQSGTTLRVYYSY